MSRRGIPGLRALDRLAPGDRRAVLLGLGVMVSAVVIIFGVRPSYRALTDARERLAVERGVLARELQLLESAAVLPKHIEEALRKTAAVDLRLLEAPSRILAEGQLTDLLESSAVLSRVLLREIESIAPARGTEPPPGTEALRLSVSGESDLEGVLTFLDALESGLLLIRVTGLALEPVLARPETNGDSQSEPIPTGVVEFQLIIESYLKTDGAAAEAEPVREGAQNT
ncbi:MAG: hypothetical protein IID07_02445 [Gemmatimonadetes bacterium]|nr:hypothetical protein [Gemmatimonadota bacterium]